MKKRGNILNLLVAETRARLASTPEAREEASADLVVTKFISGLALNDTDVEALEASLRTADAMCLAARSVGQ
jgi:hypothetical protein